MGTWEVLPVVALCSTFGTATITRAHSQITMETIRSQRLVIMAWYLKANLMAMNRSELIKVR